MADPVNFYRVSDEYGCFSNFAPYPIELDGKRWPTTEHYFQAAKFDDPTDQEEIRSAKSPMVAKRLGHDRTKKLRPDWESAKDDIMRRAVLTKFTQHADLRAKLLATADARIVEHTENDAYWGDGGDGNGKNMLGLILMEVRDKLKASEHRRD
jgi:N-glycosidase YbiA